MPRSRRCMLKVQSIMVVFAVCLTTGQAFGQGWESVDQSQLISRSRVICVGRLMKYGQAKDGQLEAKIMVSKMIYSGIGDIDSVPIKTSVKTVRGTAQYWPNRQYGIWFILKNGDRYADINHPSCWLDAGNTKAVANKVYQVMQSAYQEAKSAAQDASSSGGSSEEEQVAAYAGMAAAADAARRVPLENQGAQSQTFFNQVNDMIRIAGVKPPFDTAGGSQGLVQKFQQMLGPASELAGGMDLPMAQNGIGGLLLEMIRGTMGSKNPMESLSKLGPQQLGRAMMLPGGKGKSGGRPNAGSPFGQKGTGGRGGPQLPFGPQAGFGGGGRGKSPVSGLFGNLPTGGSRRQLLGTMTGRMGGMGQDGPRIGPPGGGGRPGFGGPGRPGGGPGRPGSGPGRPGGGPGGPPIGPRR